MPIVVGSNNALLFCEGKPSSLDISVLTRLPCAVSFLVIPSGGKQGLRSFIDGYVGAKRHSGLVLGFRDRDFDAEPTERPSLWRLPGGKEVYLSHRACVESYLLEPALIHRYWDEESVGPAWRHKKPPPPEEIHRWIEDSARDIAEYQAIRWSLAKLKPSDRWPEVPTSWTDGSGHLPGDLAFEPCLQRAQKLVESFRSTVDGVDVATLTLRAAEFRARFRDQGFWQQGAYAVWFHGKDLKKAMQKRRPAGISIDHFLGWAVERLEVDKHPDLVQLGDRLSSTRTSS